MRKKKLESNTPLSKIILVKEENSKQTFKNKFSDSSKINFPNESYQTSIIKLKKLKRRKFLIFVLIIVSISLSILITYLILKSKETTSDDWLDTNQMDKINK